MKTIKATVPKLVCNITGNDRVTTREYLDGRMAALGVTESVLLETYVCKDAMKKLRSGKSIEVIRAEMGSEETHPISAETIKTFLANNGKQKGGAAGPAISPLAAKYAAEQAAKAAATATPAVKVETKATPVPTAAPKSAPAPTPTAQPKATAAASK